MPSKTVLATNPRHWPSPEAIAAGWQESQPGLWIRDMVSARLELDGLWHSYVDPVEMRRHSPGFVTLREAMRNADERTLQMRLSA